MSHGWKKYETKSKEGFLRILYAPIPDHIPDEQVGKYIEEKEKKRAKDKSIKTYTCTTIIKSNRIKHEKET